MKKKDVERIAAWIVERGLAGASETELLHGFCDRCCEAGAAPVARDGSASTPCIRSTRAGFRWRNDGVEENAVVEYGPSNGARRPPTGSSSTFYHLLTTGANELRRRIGLATRRDFRFSTS